MGMGRGANRAQRQAETQEREQMAALRAGTDRIRSVFADPARLAQITDFVNATRGMLNRDLTRQKQTNVRENRFDLARSGMFGGSLQADRTRQLAEAYGRGLLDVERRAQEAGANLREADDAAQSRMIALLHGGLDDTTAAQQAAQSARAGLAAERPAQNVNALGDVFGGLGDAFLRNRDAANRRRADRINRFGGF